MKRWLLVHIPDAKIYHDPLTGWTGSESMTEQVSLSFASREEAIAYASREGLDYVVEKDVRDTSQPKRKRYADNFLMRYR